MISRAESGVSRVSGGEDNPLNRRVPEPLPPFSSPYPLQRGTEYVQRIETEKPFRILSIPKLTWITFL
jgi:hypothetical protein